jgi:hypothetical protein
MILKVNCNDEYYDEYPTHAKVEFTKESTDRILKLNKVLNKLKALKICDWDDVEWLDPDDELTEWDGRSECAMVMVWDNWVRWNAYIKNTSIVIETGEVTIKEIK